MNFMKKTVLVIISLIIASSLFLSNVCSGPIDRIFIGWRDLTRCVDRAPHFNFGIHNISHYRDTGALLLLFILTIILVLFLFFKFRK